MAQPFRELKVWKKAVDLALLVYELTAEFPKRETYGLSSQMQWAAVSIARLSTVCEAGRGKQL
jgi:four helix bundle protein